MSPRFDINDFKKNSPDQKLSSTEKMKAFLFKVIIYLGIIIGIVGAIYILYRFLPQFIDFFWNKIISIIKKDYPNVR